MSNNTSKLNEQLAAVVATGGSTSSATEELARLLQRRFQKEDQEEADRKREQDEYRFQQLENIERSQKERRFGQEACGHVKPNRTTALNGQRDHQGDLHTVCSYCGREFDETELRKPNWNHLLFGLTDRVGGPIR